jgi:CheY-like chemotaxis protein
MTNLRQIQIMENLLQTLIEKISKYTTRGFAANLIAKAIIDLRDENESFTYILINEMRYEEGINSLVVSEEINYVDSDKFYRALKALIQKTMECFDNGVDIHFLNDLRKDLPDVFYFIDNLDEKKSYKTKKQIMIIEESLDLIESVKNEFKKISDEYEITGTNSSVECFDLLLSGYQPGLILLDITMSDNKGKYIFNRLKKSSNWSDIPVVFLTKKNNLLNDSFSEFSVNKYITKPFEIDYLKGKIDEFYRERK